MDRVGRTLEITQTMPYAKKQTIDYAKKCLGGVSRWLINKLEGSKITVQEFFDEDELKIIISVKISELEYPKHLDRLIKP